MSKTYAESVRLPLLVNVPHPSIKFLPKIGLNIEGRNSLVENSLTSLYTKSFDRKSYISSLIGTSIFTQNSSIFKSKLYFLLKENDDNLKQKKFGDTIHTNVDQVIFKLDLRQRFQDSSLACSKKGSGSNQ